MLLRYSVSNYLSLKETQELSLVSTTLKGRVDTLIDVVGTEASAALSGLPVAILYGANASGKTNMVQALRFIRSSVLYSHSRGSPEGGVPVNPFDLDSRYREVPTACDIDFIEGGTRYHYGFKCSAEVFLEEWLYSFPEGRKRVLFERNGRDVNFGPSLKGQKKILTSLMRDNSLFISTATQNDHEDLSRVVGFFRKIRYDSTVAAAHNIVNIHFQKGDIDDRAIKFLGAIGTGISGHRKLESDHSESITAMLKDLSAVMKKHVGDFPENVDPAAEKEVSIELCHQGADGEQHFFKLDRESAGTRRLLLMLSSVFKALDQGAVVVLDEIDASLHTAATEAILEIFSDKSVNKNGAQLIATTHDTNILGSNLLRRDQIWFAEKDNFGASEIYPLSDIKSRNEDNFEAGYLEGRYGAIPFSGSISRLFAGDVR